MTRWKRWRRSTTDQYRDPKKVAAMLSYLRAREDAQPPVHPIHMRLYMRWMFQNL